MVEILKKTRPTFAASLALLFAGTVAFGQATTNQSTNQMGTNQSNTTTTPMTTQKQQEKNSVSDTQFAKQAAQGDLAEVKLGQLAEQKGTNSSVKDFGKRMVTDHTNAQDKLQAAASQDNVTLPSSPNAQQQALYERLSKLSGAQFDKAYSQAMVQDHTTDIAKFKHEANDGKNTSIKNFASQTLPTLQEHLRMAKQMQQTVSATNSTTSSAKPTS
jgi:putative membrane protein